MTMAKKASNGGGGREREDMASPLHPCFHGGPLLWPKNHDMLVNLCWASFGEVIMITLYRGGVGEVRFLEIYCHGDS